MTRPRAALTRQSLPRLLGELRASGVVEAQFHETGRLASVRFAEAPPELGDDIPGEGAEPKESGLTSSARRHLEVLRRGREQQEPKAS